ncbi:Omp28-related outer membrane protein [Bacteroidales bacterium OttesenSCG-928-C19]|nr:Omp28-related outer membrane protein [Bacteroidales bacterium OttesenSCG-928-C19]
MKNVSIFISLFVFSIIGFSFLSCDKIEKDDYLTYVKEGVEEVPEMIPSENKVQKVLIEDFTGHTCPNCPYAAEIIHSIIEKNKNVIAIGIHNSENFSKPQGAYTNNFQTTEGEKLREWFSPSGYPAGMINRNESPNTSYLTWGAKTNEAAEATPLIYMTLKGSSFDTVTKEVSAKVSFDFPKGYVENLNLVLAITENKIIGYQTKIEEGKNIHIPDYEHNHVLRQMPDGEWGVSLSFTEEDISTKSLRALRKEFTLRDDAHLVWENCYLIAYFIKNNTEKREILQVDQIALKDILK